jgi:2-haloacid dehalogenase
MPNPIEEVKVLAFDVFGTVVDWCGSVAKEIESLNPNVDGQAFARAWRAGYRPAMQRVISGEIDWKPLDELHFEVLSQVLESVGMGALGETERRELNRSWHRLQPWPDSVPGIERLKSRYIVTTLSNGNISLMVDLAKFAGLPWDCVLSAEVFGAYKPSPETYLGVARIFDVRPDQVMLVATHQHDLDAARACGLVTAYIERPFEYGRGHEKSIEKNSVNTIHASSILALADKLLG